MTTAFEAGKLLHARRQDIVTAENRAEPHVPERPVNNNPTGDSNAVTVQSVGRTERRPTKGEGRRAFGAPTSPPPLRSEADEETIRAQQAAEVSRMNERARQSTDSTN